MSNMKKVLMFELFYYAVAVVNGLSCWLGVRIPAVMLRVFVGGASKRQKPVRSFG